MAKRNELRVRRAKNSDALRIAELSGQLGYPASTVQISQRLRRLKSESQHAVFVAESDKSGVEGWLHVSLQPLLEVEIRAEIHGLVVSEKARGMGTGGRLLAAAEEWAKNRGCRSMSVRSNVIRERAHQFYERREYEHYKTQKAFRKNL